MATITTTHFTGRKEFKIPYRFTCNYCGQVNRKEVEQVVYAGSIERGNITATDFRATVVDNAIEKRLEERKNERIDQCRREIADYAAALREGTPIKLVQNKIDFSYAHRVPYGFDGVCVACGRKQAWVMPSLLPKDMEDIPKRPKEEETEPKWKRVLHSVLGIVVLLCMVVIPVGILILLGTTSLLPNVGTALIVGGVSFVVGIVILALNSPDKAEEKKKDMEFLEQYLVEKLGSEPNLVKNLPVITMNEGKKRKEMK